MHKAKGREIVRCEGHAPGKKFIGDASQGILVAFLAGSATKLLGGHVFSSFHGRPILVTCLRDGCNTKIGQKSIPIGVEEDISRFEFTVKDILVVGIVQCLSNLGQNF